MVDMQRRELPKGYIERALKLVKEVNPDPRILEVGCCRQDLRHDIDREVCAACCDGHSTYLLARSGAILISVDSDPGSIATAVRACDKFDNVHFMTIDALTFAYTWHTWDFDLIFLDAWDVDAEGCAEKHLMFYDAIKSKLVGNPFFLIDDTDLYYDHGLGEFFPDPECLSGKGELLIPALVKDGYEVVFNGRQTLLRKR